MDKCSSSKMSLENTLFKRYIIQKKSPINSNKKANKIIMNKKANVSMKFPFQDFLHHPSEELLFVTAIDAHEVNFIIPSLKTGKSIGPNSLPTKLLKL